MTNSPIWTIAHSGQSFFVCKKYKYYIFTNKINVLFKPTARWDITEDFNCEESINDVIFSVSCNIFGM